MRDAQILTKPWSKYAIGVWLALFVIFLVVFPQWQHKGGDAIISWDVFGYYLYLPAAFIYHDLAHLQFLNHLVNLYHPSDVVYQAIAQPNGNQCISYTMGLAVLYSPFFFLSHLTAILLGVSADGLSWPYQLGIYVCGGFYALVGLLLSRKVLLHFFDESVTAIALLILVLGTNYFHYSLLEVGMQHVYLFFLYAALLWLTILWHQQQQMKYTLLMGLVLGQIGLMRPTEIVAVLIPLLWGVSDFKSAMAKARLLWAHMPQLMVLAICALLVIAPQLIYWKAITGKWVFNGYGQIGFEFAHPFLMDGIFSFRKGWLIYTPIMGFAVLGFIPLYKVYKPYWLACILYFCLTTYIIFSWDVWWYGGSFGARAMVQGYAVLLLPLSAWVALMQRHRWWQAAFGFICSVFIFLNLFQDWQLQHKMFSTEGMTKYVYRLIFLKTSVTQTDIRQLDTKEWLVDTSGFSTVYQVPVVYWAFNKDTIATLLNDTGCIYFSIPISKLPYKPKAGDWARLNITAKFDEMEYSYSHMGMLNIRLIGKQHGAIVKQNTVRIQHLIANSIIGNSNDLFGKPNVWDNVHVDVEWPANENDIDSIRISMINPNGKPFAVKGAQLSFLAKNFGK